MEEDAAAAAIRLTRCDEGSPAAPLRACCCCRCSGECDRFDCSLQSLADRLWTRTSRGTWRMWFFCLPCSSWFLLRYHRQPSWRTGERGSAERKEESQRQQIAATSSRRGAEEDPHARSRAQRSRRRIASIRARRRNPAAEGAESTRARAARKDAREWSREQQESPSHQIGRISRE